MRKSDVIKWLIKAENNIYLSLYIIVDLIRLFVLLYDGSKYQYDIHIKIIATIIYSVLAYCSYKKMKIPLIIMSIFMVLSGLGAILTAILALINQQIFFGIAVILLGFVFAFGGIRIIYHLIRENRQSH
jgi:hypothetical protein